MELTAISPWVWLVETSQTSNHVHEKKTKIYIKYTESDDFHVIKWLVVIFTLG